MDCKLRLKRHYEVAAEVIRKPQNFKAVQRWDFHRSTPGKTLHVVGESGCGNRPSRGCHHIEDRPQGSLDAGRAETVRANLERPLRKIGADRVSDPMDR